MPTSQACGFPHIVGVLKGMFVQYAYLLVAYEVLALISLNNWGLWSTLLAGCSVSTTALFTGGSATPLFTALQTLNSLRAARQSTKQGQIEFEEKFQKSFSLTNKVDSRSMNVYRAAMANLVGGIGYFYGQSKIALARSSSIGVGIFIFAWTLLDLWLDLMNVDGWIPREQILGAEALSDAQALVEYTRKVLVIEDGEVVHLKADCIGIWTDQNKLVVAVGGATALAAGVYTTSYTVVLDGKIYLVLNKSYPNNCFTIIWSVLKREEIKTPYKSETENIRGYDRLQHVDMTALSSDTARLQVPEEVLQQIISYNNLDVKLYKHAQDIFAQRRKQLIEKLIEEKRKTM
ncbi:hypothetical protein Syun_016859 [Stephania yunnanensis]|uniref:mannosyl-oligosaccharide glucosidase n=1 Tax=Stephania yunnanensis TaxID=152371 RepID=A0AAP0P1V3_9MAGN